jgi:hypothetical protein
MQGVLGRRSSAAATRQMGIVRETAVQSHLSAAMRLNYDIYRAVFKIVDHASDLRKCPLG